MIGAAAFANLRKKPAGPIPSVPPAFTWDYTGSGSTPALTIDSGWPDPAVVDGLNLRQINDGAPLIRITANRQVVIQNCRLEHVGRGIESTVSITSAVITNNVFHGKNPNVDGVGESRYHVNLQCPVHTIEYNTFWGGSAGVYVNSVAQTANTFKFRYNLGRNLKDCISNGTGLPGLAGYRDQNPINLHVNTWTAHWLQLNGSNAPGADISWNYYYADAISQSDTSSPDDNWGSMNSDILNVHVCGGSSGNPLNITWNFISGSFISKYWAVGPGSGTAIIMDGGTSATAWINANNNYCTRVQNIGMSQWTFANNCETKDNYVACSGKLNGDWMYNTGIEVIYGQFNRTNCTITGNQCWEIPNPPPPSTASGARYSVISQDGNINGNVTNSNTFVAKATEAIEAYVETLWQAQKVSQSKPNPGSTIPIWW